MPDNASITRIDDIPAWLVGEPSLMSAVLPTELIVRHSTGPLNGA